MAYSKESEYNSIMNRLNSLRRMMERRGDQASVDSIEGIKKRVMQYRDTMKGRIKKEIERSQAKIEQANEYSYRQAQKVEDVRMIARELQYERILRITK